MDEPVGLLGVIGRWKGVTYQVGGLYSNDLVDWIGFCLEIPVLYYVDERG